MDTRIRALSLALLTLALVGQAVPALARGQQEEAELQLRLRQADRKLRQGDTVGALLDVEAVLSRDDGLWEAYWLRGQIQARMGDDLGARGSFVRAAELDPGNAELHFLVASLALQLGDFDAAWRQLVAAAQGGLDRARVDAMVRELADYVDDTSGLDTALSAPRVSVIPEEAASRSLRELALELRTLLLEEPAVALVQEGVPSEYELVLATVPESAAGPEPGTGTVEVALRDVDGAILLEHSLPGTGAAARVQLADLVAELVELLRERSAE